MKKKIVFACLILSAIAFAAFNKYKGEKILTVYLVVTGESVEDLARNVNENLGNKWSLQGSVSYGNGHYMQAMSK